MFRSEIHFSEPENFFEMKKLFRTATKLFLNYSKHFRSARKIYISEITVT